MADTISPFKISIPDSELSLLQRKLELTRLPQTKYTYVEENGITTAYLQKILDFWLTQYSWRDEETEINNTLPQYTTKIKVESGDGVAKENEGTELDVHFVHSPSSVPSATALLFIHGWPGSFLEISKGLKKLNEAGFHAVAPSLPGYGFSSYVQNRGFDHRGHARVFGSLMHRLGYEKFVVQGGDWGSGVARTMGLLFPDRVTAVHVNMLITPDFDFPEPKPALTSLEQRMRDRSMDYFLAQNAAYSQIQAQRPITLGHAMHDSPVGLLSYITDKLVTWSDAYPWTPKELITWTLMHYFPGPTSGFLMYFENNPTQQFVEGSYASQYMRVPLGVSVFPKEIVMMPRVYGEKVADIRMYKGHEAGGHFAMWEKPDELVEDVVEFVRELSG